MPDIPQVTRQQLATFVKDQRTLLAIEALFSRVSELGAGNVFGGNIYFGESFPAGAVAPAMLVQYTPEGEFSDLDFL